VAASAAESGWLLRAVLPLAVAGFVCATGAAIAWPALVAPALVGLGTACAIVEAAGRARLGWLILFSCLLVATAELLLWQDDVRQATEVDRSVVRSRVASLAAIVLGAAAVSAVSALAGGIRFSAAFEAALVGSAATLVVLLLAWLLLRPSGSRERASRPG
jgi:hypothetical protein